jgi:hypothetical protein
MSDQSAAPKVCSQCNARLGEHRVTITERDAASTVMSDWTFCSLSRARDLGSRLVRLGRDER